MKTSKRNTIFDDTFRTLIEKMPNLVIPFVMDQIQLTEDIQELKFPQSCVLYLRSTGPKELNLRIDFGNGTTILYQVPCVYEQNFSKEEIFEKNLLLLLPFYMLRFEDQLKHNEPFTEEFYKEILYISKALNDLAKINKGTCVYEDLANLFLQISDYVFRNKKDVREKVGGIMKGQVLELYSEQMERKGFERGIEEGRLEGMAESAIKFIKNALRTLSPEEVSKTLDVSLEEVLRVASEKK